MLKEKLCGDLDIVHADEFKKKYLALLQENKTSIEFDCAELQFVDSTGLGAFAALAAEAKKNDGKIVLKGVKPVIAKLFEITKLSSVIGVES